MSVISWIIFVFDIALAVDAGRRPASAWAAADRRKGYWVVLLAVVGFVAFIPYVIGVLPRLNAAGRAPGGDYFEKKPASPFGKS